MKLMLAILGTIGLICLSACSTQPVNGHAKTGRDTSHSSADQRADSMEDEILGLGTIVYNPNRATCERRVRTGTRIPREECTATGFNGMFPSGGLNVGTAGEGQPGYGPANQ